MLSEALPIYSGGLGNVAGDEFKAASDLGVPVAGVGLLYRPGLFSPGDRRGRRAAGCSPVQRSRTVADHAFAPTKRRVVAVGDRVAWIATLAARLAGPGRQSPKLYLLDSNDAANFPAHRGITQRALWGRTGVAPQAGTAPRDRRMATAPRPRGPTGGLSPE